MRIEGQGTGRATVGDNRRYVLAAAATGFRAFMARNGGGAEQVFCDVGVEEQALQDATAGLDLSTYVAMMEQAARLTGKDNFGLWYGQEFRPEMLGLIGGVTLTAPTLGAALSNMVALFPYHQQATQTGLIADGGMMQLQYRILDGGIVERRQDAELTLGMFVNVFRHGLGHGWAPEEIHFEHPRPQDWRAHEDAFSAPVYFGQRTNAVIFSSKDLHRPMPGGDLRRLDQLRGQLQRIGRDSEMVSLLDHVRGQIRSALPDGLPYIETIADALSMPRWTLQRRLADQGLSFSDLVDQVRRTLAEHYIRQPHVPIVEIADILGYSELSAFSRAFSRWFGVSPRRYRARLG